MNKTIIGYKGFDKEMKCQGLQYEVGKEYTHDGEIVLCSQGLHFCELPLAVFSYYPLSNGNQFGVIKARGKIKNKNDKSVTDKMFIKSKIDIDGMVKASVEFIWNKAKGGGIFKKEKATSGSRANSATSGSRANSATSGSYAHSATSGDDANSATSGSYAHSATSGSRANSATSGSYAHSATSGDDNIAVSVGRKAKAKASLGCFIVLAEWKEGEKFTDAKPIGVISAKVDGKKIKANQWYKAVKGKFVETDDSNE